MFDWFGNPVEQVLEQCLLVTVSTHMEAQTDGENNLLIPFGGIAREFDNTTEEAT